MALTDFLAETSEIKIIDFLAENIDREYNQTELSNYTGLSRTTVHEKLPKLIHNKIIKISGEYGQSKFFTLKENDIVEHLIAAAMAHSFAMAEEELEDEEAIALIEKRLEMTIEEGLLEIFQSSTSDIELGVLSSSFGKIQHERVPDIKVKVATTKGAWDINDKFTNMHTDYLSETKKRREKIPLEALV